MPPIWGGHQTSIANVAGKFFEGFSQKTVHCLGWLHIMTPANRMPKLEATTKIQEI